MKTTNNLPESAKPSWALVDFCWPTWIFWANENRTDLKALWLVKTYEWTKFSSKEHSNNILVNIGNIETLSNWAILNKIGNMILWLHNFEITLTLLRICLES